MGSATAHSGNKRHILNLWKPHSLSIDCYVFKWSRRSTDRGPKEALRYLLFPTMNGKIMSLNPSIGNRSDSAIHIYPPLRNNMCLYGVMCSLWTYGNTEAWGVVCHGSVPYCCRASCQLIYINVQTSIYITGNVGSSSRWTPVTEKQDEAANEERSRQPQCFWKH